VREVLSRVPLNTDPVDCSRAPMRLIRAAVGVRVAQVRVGEPHASRW